MPDPKFSVQPRRAWRLRDERSLRGDVLRGDTAASRENPNRRQRRHAVAPARLDSVSSPCRQRTRGARKRERPRGLGDARARPRLRSRSRSRRRRREGPVGVGRRGAPAEGWRAGWRRRTRGTARTPIPDRSCGRSSRRGEAAWADPGRAAPRSFGTAVEEQNAGERQPGRDVALPAPVRAGGYPRADSRTGDRRPTSTRGGDDPRKPRQEVGVRAHFVAPRRTVGSALDLRHFLVDARRNRVEVTRIRVLLATDAASESLYVQLSCRRVIDVELRPGIRTGSNSATAASIATGTHHRRADASPGAPGGGAFTPRRPLVRVRSPPAPSAAAPAGSRGPRRTSQYRSRTDLHTIRTRTARSGAAPSWTTTRTGCGPGVNAPTSRPRPCTTIRSRG